MIFDWLSYEKKKYDNGMEYQDWAEALGWLCTLVVVVAIIIPPIFHFIVEDGGFFQVNHSIILYCIARPQ